jgi:predicted nucleic acid-binding protein
LTLYVESNFVLEIALGQEELVSAEKLLSAAERGAVQIALPSFALSEPFSRVTRGIRDRQAFVRQLNAQVEQLGRSTPHREEVGELQMIPSLVGRIDQREADRLHDTVSRILSTARLIELDGSMFQSAAVYKTRFGLSIEDAVILAVVIEDLKRSRSPKRHMFANRNKSDFSQPEIVVELYRLGCDFTSSFAEAARAFGVK